MSANSTTAPMVPLDNPVVLNIMDLYGVMLVGTILSAALWGISCMQMYVARPLALPQPRPLLIYRTATGSFISYGTPLQSICRFPSLSAPLTLRRRYGSDRMFLKVLVGFRVYYTVVAFVDHPVGRWCLVRGEPADLQAPNSLAASEGRWTRSSRF